MHGLLRRWVLLRNNVASNAYSKLGVDMLWNILVPHHKERDCLFRNLYRAFW